MYRAPLLLLACCLLPLTARGQALDRPTAQAAVQATPPAAAQAAPAAVTGATPLCPRIVADVAPARRLPHLAAAIAAGGPVEILAIGSATTSGQDSSGEAAFPQRMVRALRADRPDVSFGLTVQGAKGMTAEAMLEPIAAGLKAHRIALVIWQTGTVEAARDIPPASFRTVLDTGVDRIHEAGADLVLIGPQFSRVLRAKVDPAPYEQVLAAVGAESDTLLFPRSDITRDWAEQGHIDVERATKGERQTTLEALHGCIGAALARFVLAAGEPR